MDVKIKRNYNDTTKKIEPIEPIVKEVYTDKIPIDWKASRPPIEEQSNPYKEVSVPTPTQTENTSDENSNIKTKKRKQT